MTKKKYTHQTILRSDARLHSIKETTEATGVSEDELRTWERHHNIINPTRTLKGQTLYSDSDIFRINQTKSLLKEGVQLNQISKILAQETGSLSDIIPPANRGDQLEWQEHKAQIVACLETRDFATLATLHHHLFDNYSPAELYEMLCVSILEELKARSEANPKEAGPYYSYMSYLHAFLGHRTIMGFYPDTNPRILIVNCSQSYHMQMRVLWYVLVLADGGFNTHFLDQKPPHETVVESIKSFDYAGVIILEHPYDDIKNIEEDIASRLPTFMNSENSVNNEPVTDEITFLPKEISENIAILKERLT